MSAVGLVRLGDPPVVDTPDTLGRSLDSENPGVQPLEQEAFRVALPLIQQGIASDPERDAWQARRDEMRRVYEHAAREVERATIGTSEYGESTALMREAQQQLDDLERAKPSDHGN